MTKSVAPKNEELRPDTYVDVMSLCNNLLNLRTNRGGDKPIYKIFRKFGEVQRILYSDLIDIMDRHPSFVENGTFYILDEAVVRRHGLEDAYSKLLDKERIEKIVSGETDDALLLYKSANDSQKKMIVSMIVEKIRDGSNIDMNFVYQLEKFSGIKISEKVDDAHKFTEIQTSVPVSAVR